MVAELGEEVLRLVRTAISDLTDRTLKPGQWRQLQPAEVRRLFAAGDGRAAKASCENDLGHQEDWGHD